jgi:hypothetical protein
VLLGLRQRAAEFFNLCVFLFEFSCAKRYSVRSDSASLGMFNSFMRQDCFSLSSSNCDFSVKGLWQRLLSVAIHKGFVRAAKRCASVTAPSGHPQFSHASVQELL